MKAYKLLNETCKTYLHYTAFDINSTLKIEFKKCLQPVVYLCKSTKIDVEPIAKYFNAKQEIYYDFQQG